MSRIARTLADGAVSGALIAVALVPGSASAARPVGECPISHSTVVTREEALEIDGAVLFDIVNKNGDNIVCFKPWHKKLPGGTVIDNHARHNSS
jgi:hypothetical protein